MPEFFIIETTELVQMRCAYCEKIFGCRVKRIEQKCQTCPDTYCSLPQLEEWRICPQCRAKLKGA